MHINHVSEWGCRRQQRT